MKNEDMILFAIVALGVFALTKTIGGARAATSTTAPQNNYNVREIMRDNGWVYYSDGTAIDPQGRYYYQGDFVYNPMGMYQ